KKNHQFHL
ncbi:hypothetical protein D039_2365B, partial [Vibrio parahaemolyticus EKP-028]